MKAERMTARGWKFRFGEGDAVRAAGFCDIK